MTKVFEAAVERVRKLSKERQDYAADILDQIADAGDGIYVLSDDERKLVREGLDELERGEIAQDADVRAVFDRYRT